MTGTGYIISLLVLSAILILLIAVIVATLRDFDKRLMDLEDRVTQLHRHLHSVHSDVVTLKIRHGMPLSDDPRYQR